jgi:hypothetical protein
MPCFFGKVYLILIKKADTCKQGIDLMISTGELSPDLKKQVYFMRRKPPAFFFASWAFSSP